MALKGFIKYLTEYEVLCKGHKVKSPIVIIQLSSQQDMQIKCFAEGQMKLTVANLNYKRLFRKKANVISTQLTITTKCMRQNV